MMSQENVARSKELKIEVWTDGACFPNPGRGGWAWVTRCGKSGSGFEPETTNQRMEIQAALSAITALAPEYQEVHIRSDSQYLIKGCTLWMRDWKMRRWRKKNGDAVLHSELWMALDEAMSQSQVKFLWVKGHSGDEMNDRADLLAGKATGLRRDEIRKFEYQYKAMRYGGR